ncbi:MAG TPA: hypothetical protein VK574_20935 [Terracidiphilus sp.]|nr:hypothetical protein [Terracidiphilus sp.]
MSDPASTSPPKDVGTFASLLASLTGSLQHTSPSWDDSALADDVATISYEQALRSHRRVPPVAALPENESQFPSAPTTRLAHPANKEKKRKTSSITIRLTEAEEAQLHERAAAAQLTVSAYLRSCIFEAESLRAQVKEALSEIHAAAQTDPVPQPQSRSASSWRARLLPHWRGPA